MQARAAGFNFGTDQSLRTNDSLRGSLSDAPAVDSTELIDFDELRNRRVQRATSIEVDPYQDLELHEFGHGGSTRARADRERQLRDEEALDRMLDDGTRSGRSRGARERRDSDSERAKCPPCHWGLYVTTLFFGILSIPLVYSASTAIALDNHSNPSYFLARQIAFVFAGILGLIGMSRLPERRMRTVLWTLYAVALIGLLATSFTPLGLRQGNVVRWVKLGPIPLQFSELAKIALIGVMADFWSKAALSSQRSMWAWAGALIVSMPMVGLVFLQPHLSAALLLFIIPFALAYYAGVPMKQMATLLVPLVVAAVVGIGLCRAGQMPLMKPYQQERIARHFGGDGKENRDAHYQSLQGQKALMHGGLAGVGLGQSYYKHGQLPAPHTDFILAILGEEWGLLGMIALLACYGVLVFFCFQIGHAANTAFESLVCAGVGTLLAVQVVCNAGVVTGLLPVTGMPLPLLSYGGSGLLCTMLGLGLVLGVSRQMGNEEQTQTVPSTAFSAAVPSAAT